MKNSHDFHLPPLPFFHCIICETEEEEIAAAALLLLLLSLLRGQLKVKREEAKRNGKEEGGSQGGANRKKKFRCAKRWEREARIFLGVAFFSEDMGCAIIVIFSFSPLEHPKKEGIESHVHKNIQ